jgi:hypothetical protein
MAGIDIIDPKMEQKCLKINLRFLIFLPML